MKTRRLPLRQAPGVHLRALAPNHWAVYAEHGASFRRVEVEGRGRWEVTMDNRARGTWTDPMQALAHAYALASGQSSI